MELSNHVPVQWLQTNYKLSCVAVLRIVPLPVFVDMNVTREILAFRDRNVIKVEMCLIENFVDHRAKRILFSLKCKLKIRVEYLFIKKINKIIKTLYLNYVGFIMSGNKGCEKIAVKVIKKHKLTQWKTYFKIAYSTEN